MNRKNAENKEAVYDELIYPLMSQIVRICYENGIAMVAQFHVPNPDDPDLMCSTQLTDADDKIPWQLMQAWRREDDTHAAASPGRPGWAGYDVSELSPR